MLKEELRNVERSQKREGVDMTYLKNVILKLLETGMCMQKKKKKRVKMIKTSVFLLSLVHLFNAKYQKGLYIVLFKLR